MKRLTMLVPLLLGLAVARADAPDCDDVVNAPDLQTWRLSPAIADWYAKLEAGQIGSYMIVGDSMSIRADSYNWFLIRLLRERYGNAGDGYFGVGGGFTAPDPADDPRIAARFPQKLRRSLTGSHAAINNFAREEPWGTYTPDGLYGAVWNDGWIELDFHGTRGTLYYLREPDGGVIELTLNGEHLADIYTNSNHVTTGVLTFETGAADNDTISTLRIEAKLNRRIQVHGLLLESDEPGVIYHKIGRGGEGPDDFLRSRNYPSRAILNELRPDVVFVMLDWTNQTTETYEQDMNDLLDFYETVLPQAKFVLMSHHPFEPDVITQMYILRRIACERGCGFINLSELFADFDEMDQLGFIADNVHFTAEGGMWFAQHIFDLLMAAGETCRGDVNRDGAVDFTDLEQLLNDWGGSAADIDLDGVTGFSDLNIVLQTWGGDCL